MITDCLLFHLAKSYQRAHQGIRETLKPYGLTPIQSLVLTYISEKEQIISAGEVSRDLKLDNATLSGILDRLEAGAWLERRLSEEDKRLSLISPTSKFTSIKKEIDMKRQLAEEEMLSNFSIEEKMLFKRMLKDMR